MTLQFLSHVIVFYIFHNIQIMIYIFEQITFRKIFFKLKNVFSTNKFMVYAYEKKEFNRP